MEAEAEGGLLMDCWWLLVLEGGWRGKTQALSYQETQKKQVQQSMLPYGLSQTNTHSTSYDSSEHALAHLAEACFIFYCSRVVLDNTSPVQ